MIKWPFCLRSSLNRYKLLLTLERERSKDLGLALTQAQKELRKYKLLVSGRYELFPLKEKTP